MSYFLYLKPMVLFFITLFLVPLKLLACQFIGDKPIEQLEKEGNILYFECPPEANAIELCSQDTSLKAIACNFDGELEKFMAEDNFDKGTINGKKERTYSYLTLKAFDDCVLICKGHFKHPLAILIEGYGFRFENCIFTQTEGVIMKPHAFKEENPLNYIKLIPVNSTMPIYVQGNANIHTLTFPPCETFDNRCFMTVNAHIEISLNKKKSED